MALTENTQNRLAALSEEHILALCHGFGINKRKKSTAFTALCLQDDAAVVAALDVLQQELDRHERIRTAVAAKNAPSETEQAQPMCLFQCEETLEYFYNKPRRYQGGVEYEMPYSMGVYAAKVAQTIAGGPYRYRLNRLASED